MDVNSIEAGFDGAGGTRRKCRYRFTDLVFARFVHHPSGQRVGDRRRGERPVACDARLAARVGELREYFSAVAVHGLDQAPEPWQHAVLVDAHLAQRVATSRIAEHVAAQDQTNLVSSQLLIDFDQLVGDLARVARSGFRGACPDDSIRGGHRSDPAGLKQDSGRHGRRSYQSR